MASRPSIRSWSTRYHPRAESAMKESAGDTGAFSHARRTRVPQMLSVEQISKVFGESESGYSALKDISMEIAQGEFVCLLGPSGCGKTTLLNILAGFERATFGRATFNGKTISGPA